MRTKVEGRTHPTKAKLLNTYVELLDTHSIEDITLDMVLRSSRISKGSLYHHFKDFDELIESAEVQSFSAYVDLSILKLSQAAMQSNSVGEFRQQLHKVTVATQNPELAILRMNRVSALARAGKSPRFHEALGKEQQRLTDGITELVETAQDRGLVRTEVDARAIALLIQAYTLGRVVDDVVENKVDPNKWIEVIDQIADIFLNFSVM
jgi:AcrR family transcriptional regulator